MQTIRSKLSKEQIQQVVHTITRESLKALVVSTSDAIEQGTEWSEMLIDHEQGGYLIDISPYWRVGDEFVETIKDVVQATIFDTLDSMEGQAIENSNKILDDFEIITEN